MSHYDRPPRSPKRAPWRKQKPRDLYVVVSTLTGHVKVGVAANVRARLSTIQSGNPSEVVLLAHLPGKAHLESRVKDALRDHVERGEWFKPHTLPWFKRALGLEVA